MAAEHCRQRELLEETPYSGDERGVLGILLWLVRLEQNECGSQGQAGNTKG